MLEQLIANDTNKIIKELLTDDIKKLYLPKNIPHKNIEVLPEEVGVYYLHDKDGNLLFVEKSKNIREHIFALYSIKPNEKSKQLLFNETYDISFELTGNELIAALIEKAAIKQYNPKYNKPIANSFYRYGLFSETDNNGFQKIFVKAVEEDENPLLKFSSKFKAEKMMHAILSNFRLEPTFKKIDTAIQYNQRMQETLAKYIFPHKNFFIIDTGRNGAEKSAIQIENGEYKGFGFFEPNYIQHPDKLKTTIKATNETFDNKKLIQNYIRKNAKYIELIAY